MKYLLDSHVILWWLESPKLLGKHRHIIEESRNICLISAGTAWELEVKSAMGKLSIPSNFEEAINSCGFHELPLKMSHAKTIQTLPLLHKDPFDRMLICQALCENLTLISRDKIFKEYNVNVLLV